MDIISRVEGVLEEGDFSYCHYSGCFDIAASRDFTIFLKVLDNVDSFQENQAHNLKIISKNFDAAIAVVGTHTRREKLLNSVVYERFDVPAFTPDTFEGIVVNNLFPALYSRRGGLLAEIDPQKLKDGRERAGLTQKKLAEMVGVTKKSIYEHEAGRKKMDAATARKIEKILGDVTDPVVLSFEYEVAKSAPKNSFEKAVTRDMNKIGLDTDSVCQTPFNILARTENILLLSAVEENERRLKREAEHAAELSRITNVPALGITRKESSIAIPSVTEAELKDMNLKDLRKALK